MTDLISEADSRHLKPSRILNYRTKRLWIKNLRKMTFHHVAIQQNILLLATHEKCSDLIAAKGSGFERLAAEVTDDKCEHTAELVDPPPLKLMAGRRAGKNLILVLNPAQKVTDYIGS
jgi:hypothetical protein